VYVYIYREDFAIIPVSEWIYYWLTAGTVKFLAVCNIVSILLTFLILMFSCCSTESLYLFILLSYLLSFSTATSVCGLWCILHANNDFSDRWTMHLHFVFCWQFLSWSAVICMHCA